MFTFNEEVLDINGQENYYYDFETDVLDIKEAAEEQLYQEACAHDAYTVVVYNHGENIYSEFIKEEDAIKAYRALSGSDLPHELWCGTFLYHEEDGSWEQMV